MNAAEPVPRQGRRLAAALAMAAALAGCGAGGDDATGATWVVLGSSTAAGVGAPAGQGWVALLADAAAAQGVAVRNLARSGALTYQALPADAPRPAGRPATVAEMGIEAALASSPERVVLSFPSNDAMAGYGADETAGNLLALAAAAARRGAAAVVLSSQPRDDASEAQRATMRAVDAALAAPLAGCFVDLRAALSDAHGRIAAAFSAGDGVHLNAQGHRLIHERVSAAIASGRCVAPGR